MCTAVSLIGKRHLFGRTLDLECSYGESVAVLPLGHRYSFLHEGTVEGKYSVVGMAHIKMGVPLYYDGMNGAGVAIAALNFPHRAAYFPVRSDMRNLAAFEVIPWVLSQCESVADAVGLLEGVNITDESFDRSLSVTPLHWMISDKSCSVAVEPLASGLSVRDNTLGVMTNSPELEHHLCRTAELMHLSPGSPRNTLAPDVELDEFSRGLGAYGLPGDFSSTSRFVRAVFAKNHTRVGVCDDVERFFHVMDTVSVPLGAIVTRKDAAVCTVYTSCMDTESGIYYFTTYKNRRIRAVRASNAADCGAEMATYSIERGADVEFLV